MSGFEVIEDRIYAANIYMSRPENEPDDILDMVDIFYRQNEEGVVSYEVVFKPDYLHICRVVKGSITSDSLEFCLNIVKGMAREKERVQFYRKEKGEWMACFYTNTI